MNLKDIYNKVVEHINNMTLEDFQRLQKQTSESLNCNNEPDEYSEFIEKVIRDAFDAGEVWGTFYSGWFFPSEEDKEKRVQQVLQRYI